MSISTNLLESEKQSVIPSPRTFIKLFIIICTICSLAQSVGQTLISKITFFGEQSGWQTEIAIWNLGLVLVLIAILRSNKGIERDIILGLTVLPTLFSINHLIAAFNSSASPLDWHTCLNPGFGNFFMFFFNLMGAILCVIVYMQSKPSKTDV